MLVGARDGERPDTPAERPDDVVVGAAHTDRCGVAAEHHIGPRASADGNCQRAGPEAVREDGEPRVAHPGHGLGLREVGDEHGDGQVAGPALQVEELVDRGGPGQRGSKPVHRVGRDPDDTTALEGNGEVRDGCHGAHGLQRATTTRFRPARSRRTSTT